jgi:hypothetical protein
MQLMKNKKAQEAGGETKGPMQWLIPLILIVVALILIILIVKGIIPRILS